MKFKSKLVLTSASLLTALLLGTSVQTVSADLLTGSYTFGGTTTPTSQTGPWNMTSTDTTFAVLRFVLDTPTKFQDLANISYDYDSNLGGIGGGSPRLAVVLDDLSSFLIHWGPAGSYIDTTVADNLSTGNLLALTDVGRYDLTGIGGNQYADRNAALAAAGTMNVVRLSLIIDSFNGNDRDFDIKSVTVNDSNTASVPDTGNTLALLGIGVVGLAGINYRNRKQSV